MLYFQDRCQGINPCGIRAPARIIVRRDIVSIGERISLRRLIQIYPDPAGIDRQPMVERVNDHLDSAGIDVMQLQIRGKYGYRIVRPVGLQADLLIFYH